LHPAFAKAERVVSLAKGQPHWEILARRLLEDCWELSELLGLPGEHEVEGRSEVRICEGGESGLPD
jgi:hypothetical protein